MLFRSPRAVVKIGESLFNKPIFNTLPKGAYYFLLKQHFLKGDKEILNWTEKEGGGHAQLDVFNLYHLVSTNVFEFDPIENQFYDKEVQLEEIDKLITQLKKRDNIICPPQINALYLEYHLKALYYLERYFSPGNEKQAKIVDASLNFITEYYKKRASAVSPRLSLHVAKQLNLFNWLPSSKPGAWYGYDLINTIAKQRILSEEELKLLAHYKKMYDPKFKTKLPIILSKETIVDLWNEAY